MPSPSPLALSELPFAVMIDNLADARPHSGLGAADVVYEAPAEGGIPRLLALFLRQDGEADRIGPVRSARHYFVWLAAEYHAALVHIGSSPQGFQALQDTSTPRVDEARGDGGFARDPRRSAPHNAYVSTASVRGELRQRGARLSPTTAGLTSGTPQPGPDRATHLAIHYPGMEGYVVDYAYDAGTRTYLRSMDGRPHADAVSGQQYAARSVIVQRASAVPIPGDEALRINVGLVGSGQGLLLVDGTQVPLQWSKANIYQPTRFRREDGKPFELPAGQVWIQITPLESTVDVSPR